MTAITEHLLSEEVRRQIDQWVQRYPADQRRSGILQALTLVQAENGGFLNQTLIHAVADYLDVSGIAADEVATFYNLYHLKPVGRYVIDVCTNISCMLSGSEQTMAYFEKKLGIRVGETTPDGKVTLRAVECLAACTDAPVCQIGKKYHVQLTPQKIDTLLETLE